MDDGNLYQTVRLAESHGYERVEVDYDTTFQEQPENRRHPCRGCLEYYDIGCMCVSNGSSNGICKVCQAEYIVGYRQSPEGKATTEKYSQSPKRKVGQKEYSKKYFKSPIGKAALKKYKQSPKGKAAKRRGYCKEVSLKMIHKDLYADLWVG